VRATKQIGALAPFVDDSSFGNHDFLEIPMNRPTPWLATVVFLSLVPACLTPGIAHAQGTTPVEVGGLQELRELDSLPGNVLLDYVGPTFAERAGGGYLAGWFQTVTGGDEPEQVQVEAYNHLDRQVGPVREIASHPQSPAVGGVRVDLASSAGRVFAGWSQFVDGDRRVLVRYLDDTGRPVTEARVASQGASSDLDVALTASGIGLVVWREFASGDLYGRIYSPNGVPTMESFEIPNGGPGSSPRVGADAEGNFLVAWIERFQGANRLRARWVDVLGRTVVPTFGVADSGVVDLDVAVAADGRAVIVWSSCLSSAQDPTRPCEVRALLLGTDGTPDGDDFALSADDGRVHERPAVALGPAGDFAVAWRTCRANPVGARFDCVVTTSFHQPNGDRHGNRLQAPKAGEPSRLDVTALGDDDFLVGWYRFNCDALSCDPLLDGIVAQRYRLVEPSEALGDELIPEIPAGAPVLTSPELPDFRFRVRIGRPGADLFGSQEFDCLAEAICVSGAVEGRTEAILRIIGPRPNGFLWPTLVKLTTSTLEVWIEQVSTGEIQYYGLDGATQGSSELPGLFDRTGFEP
jgi:hypothetical protein